MASVKYKKITSEDLFKLMATRNADFMLWGLSIAGPALPIHAIANRLETSIHQVKKCMKELKAKGLVKIETFNFSDEYDSYPPVKMFVLSKKAQELEEVKAIDKQVEKEILNHFGIN